jgi:hypothetical protein
MNRMKDKREERERERENVNSHETFTDFKLSWNMSFATFLIIKINISVGIHNEDEYL